MPRMAFRRRFTRRRFSKGKRRLYRWTGDFQVAETLVAAAGNSQFQIILPTDWQQTVTLESSGPTLVRVVGQVNLRATVLGALAFMHLIVVDDDAGFGAALDPSQFESIREGHVIWRYQCMVPIDTNRTLEVDTTVQRKMVDQQLLFILAAVGAGVTYNSGFRVLLANSF